MYFALVCVRLYVCLLQFACHPILHIDMLIGKRVRHMYRYNCTLENVRKCDSCCWLYQPLYIPRYTYIHTYEYVFRNVA